VTARELIQRALTQLGASQIRDEVVYAQMKTMTKGWSHRPVQVLHRYEFARGLTDADYTTLRVNGIKPDA
jgi:hypothetical protein